MSKSKARIHVIGTGGSIAGVGPNRLDYTQYAELGEKLTIQQSLDRIPEVGDISEVTSEDFISVGSCLLYTSPSPRDRG